VATSVNLARTLLFEKLPWIFPTMRIIFAEFGDLALLRVFASNHFCARALNYTAWNAYTNLIIWIMWTAKRWILSIYADWQSCLLITLIFRNKYIFMLPKQKNIKKCIKRKNRIRRTKNKWSNIILMLLSCKN